MSTAKSDSLDHLIAATDAMRPDLTAFYEDLHRHPELSFQEERTAAKAAERLKDEGYAVATGVGRTGVVGILENGAGPTVMLRADMDALPVREQTGLPTPARRPASIPMASDGRCDARVRSRYARHLPRGGGGLARAQSRSMGGAPDDDFSAGRGNRFRRAAR